MQHPHATAAISVLLPTSASWWWEKCFVCNLLAPSWKLRRSRNENGGKEGPALLGTFQRPHSSLVFSMAWWYLLGKWFGFMAWRVFLLVHPCTKYHLKDREPPPLSTALVCSLVLPADPLFGTCASRTNTSCLCYGCVFLGCLGLFLPAVLGIGRWMLHCCHVAVAHVVASASANPCMRQSLLQQKQHPAVFHSAASVARMTTKCPWPRHSPLLYNPEVSQWNFWCCWVHVPCSSQCHRLGLSLERLNSKFLIRKHHALQVLKSGPRWL